MPAQTTLIRNVLTLFFGNVVAFLVPLVLYPVLSRVFTQADYAVFGLFSSIFAFLEIASTGRYDLAIVIPKQSEDGINLVAGGFLISVLYSLLIFFLVLLLGNFTAQNLNNGDLAKWLLLMPGGLFFISISKLCNAWLIRSKCFKAASVNKASQKIAEGLAQVSLGFLRIGNGLVLGDLAGRFFNAAFSIYQSVKHGLDRNKINFESISANLKTHIEFPKYSILPSMLNTLAGMMPVFIVSMYYSVENSGDFNFSRIVLSVPFALIATGISQVLMQQVSERKRNGEPIEEEVYSLAKKLFAISVIGTVVIFLFGPELFEFVFGAKWKVAGWYTSILILSTSISLVVSPFSILLPTLGRVRWGSYWQVFYFVFVSTLWFLKDIDIIKFFIAIVVVDVISYLLYGVVIVKAIRDYSSTLAKIHV